MCKLSWASQGVLLVKNLPAHAWDIRDTGSIPGSGRLPREGDDNPLQYSCLENPMDRGAWGATVHKVAKSQTRLKWLSMCGHTQTCIYQHHDCDNYKHKCQGLVFGDSNSQAVWPVVTWFFEMVNNSYYGSEHIEYTVALIFTVS